MAKYFSPVTPLPYHGLTRGSAFQTVLPVAGAVNEIIREFNAENEQ